jgi:AAA domain
MSDDPLASMASYDETYSTDDWRDEPGLYDDEPPCTPSTPCGHCDHCVEESRNGQRDDKRTPTSWAPVDLTDALAGADIEPPELWERTDGVRLIYRARVHWFQGESETCKSWAAQQVVVDELAQGHDVLYIDFEDDDRGVVARLRALGADVEAIGEHLVYLRPDEPLQDRQGRFNGALDLFPLLEARSFTLAVIDGVTEAMTTEGLGLLDNTEIAQWMRRLPRRIASRGTAVICLDHLPKSTEAQGRYAIGGQHKLAGLSGAAYKFVTLRPLGRALGADPVEGAVTITVMKDRPGWVRGRAPEGRVGTLELTAWPDGGVTTRLVPPTEELPADMIVCRRVLAYLADYDGSSLRALQEIRGDNNAIRDAARWMAAPERGWVRIEQKGRAHLHWLTDSGREQLQHDDP